MECVEALGEARKEVQSLTRLVAGFREKGSRGIDKTDLYRSLSIVQEEILRHAEASLAQGLSELALRFIECGRDLHPLRELIDTL
ncbi:MAG TPA: hypothetical protein VHL58_09865 [Thermoanaerobaculia bacterium]|nr:hypothetical protein [Thermoanaerobaculia bacterium]